LVAPPLQRIKLPENKKNGLCFTIVAVPQL
jgi:hypothetical protein